MLYNRELAKRFISDYKLPIPLINEEYFFYHLNLYEEDYGSLTKYEALLNIIDTLYDGDCNKFLENYYNVRDKIITTGLQKVIPGSKIRIVENVLDDSGKHDKPNIFVRVFNKIKRVFNKE